MGEKDAPNCVLNAQVYHTFTSRNYITISMLLRMCGTTSGGKHSLFIFIFSFLFLLVFITLLRTRVKRMKQDEATTAAAEEEEQQLQRIAKGGKKMWKNKNPKVFLIRP